VVDIDGAVDMASTLTIAGAISLNDGTDNFNIGVTTNKLTIKSTTSDGSDDTSILIDAGAGGESSSRGGYIEVHGNETSADPGKVIYQMGSVSGSVHEFRKAGGTAAAIIDSSGNVGLGGTPATNTKLLVKAGTNLNFEVENSSSNLRLSALNDARSANVGMQFASSGFEFLTGAVDMASTLTLSGALSAKGGVVFNEDSADVDFRVEGNNSANLLFVDGGNDHICMNTSTDAGGVLNIKTTDNTANLVLFCTDADTAGGPILDLTRNNDSAAADDVLGLIRFKGDDAGNNETTYAQMIGFIGTATEGSEGGIFKIEVASHDAGMEVGLAIKDGNANGELDVDIASGTSSVTTIAGRVGIGGVTAPEEDVHVAGMLMSTSSSSTGSTAGTERAVMDLSSHIARIGHMRGTTGAGSGGISFLVDSTEKMSIDASGNVTVPNGDLTITSTDAASTTASPILILARDGASPEDNDVMGQIVFKMDDDAGNMSTFARIETIAADVSNGGEDGTLNFVVADDDTFVTALSLVGGSAGAATFNSSVSLGGNLTFTAADGMEILAKETLAVTIDSDDNQSSRAFIVRSGASGSYESLMQLSETTGATFNEDALAALDFRVESTNKANMLFVDGGENRVGVNTGSPAATFTVKGTANSYAGGFQVEGTDETSAFAIAHIDGATFISGNATNDHLKITANGEFTMPLQPAFLAQPASTQSNFGADGNNDTVVFGTERFDVGANFASNTFTAPVTGKYQLSVNLYLTDLDSAASYYQMTLITSNRNYFYAYDVSSTDSDPNRFTFQLTVLADMDANDTASVGVLQSGGTAQTDINVESFFSGFLAC